MVCAITSPKNKSIGKYFFHRTMTIHPKASTHETWAGDNLKVATMIGFVNEFTAFNLISTSTSSSISLEKVFLVFGAELLFFSSALI